MCSKCKIIGLILLGVHLSFNGPFVRVSYIRVEVGVKIIRHNLVLRVEVGVKLIRHNLVLMCLDTMLPYLNLFG